MSGMNRIVYDDEDNAPMSDGIGLPYPLRTWDEMIKAWEGKHNAYGQGQVSGRLETDRANSEGKSRMDLPGLRDAVQETGRAV